MGNKNLFEIECSLSPYYSYAYYKSGIRLISRLYVKNLSDQDLEEAELVILSDRFTIPYKKKLFLIPYESTIDIDTSDLQINPFLLINTEQQREITVNIKLTKNDENICSQNILVIILPYNVFPGISVYPELLSCFIKEHKAAEKILKSADDILKGWKQNSLRGYENKDKNDIRLYAAAVFRAIQQQNIEKDSNVFDIQRQLALTNPENILTSKKATAFEMGLLFASCIEMAGLDCVLAIGKNDFLAGVWLIENCFMDSCFDDITELKKRSDENINEIAVVDINELFALSRQNFAGAEKYAAEKMLTSDFLCVLDLKRCRIGNFKPLPERVKKGEIYDILPEKSILDQMPAEKQKNIRPIKLKPLPAKESQWERRLLDLSLRNSLLNFVPKNNVLQILSVFIMSTVNNLLKGDEFNLYEMPSEFNNHIDKTGGFNTPLKIKLLSELIEVEQKNKRLRTFFDTKNLNTAASLLYRKEKNFLEETGTSTLYAACGFLKWQFSSDKNNFKYAPLVLIPVMLKKKAGGKGYSVSIREDEFQFNTTLLEFLKQEFGLEMRGIDNIKSLEDIESVLVTVKKQILNYKGWEVTEDVYIASFSFSRYLMWNDLRNHMDNFKKNKIIASLAENKADRSLLKTDEILNAEEKEKGKQRLFIPLSADSYQYEAVKLSDKNVSFVLHGPPGTGKSQTITNIIANAIAKGKKVLFVAEKTAALSVVKKRLDDIGVGDFCLELHSSKTAKNEFCKKLIGNSELKDNDETGFESKLKQLNELNKAIALPIEVLFKKRQLGLSVYDGILKVKEYKDASECMDIDGFFYEKLTEEKLKRYESLLSELVFVSKQCGQIYRSPFMDVELTDYQENFIPAIEISVSILQEEARHLNTYTQICFEILGGRTRVKSKKKLLLLKDICNMLIKSGNPYKKLFENVMRNDAVKVLNEFISIYREYEKQEENYNSLFMSKVELPASVNLLREELEIFPIEFYKSKPLKALIKKIDKAAKQKVKVEHVREYIETVLVYYEKKSETAIAGENLSDLLSGGKNERVNYNQIADFILQLDALYDSLTKLFIHYDSVSFNHLLKNLFANYPEAIFQSFLNAFESFEISRKSFFKFMDINKDYEDVDEDYTNFISLKAAAIKDNIDMLSGWCSFNIISKKLKSEGLSFALQPLMDGKISSENVLSCFNKKVYTDFVEKEIAADETLSKFSSVIIEEKIEKFKMLYEEFEKITQQEIRLRLIQKIPTLNTEGNLSVELMQLQRAFKSNMRGITIRNLIAQQRNLFFVLSPCLLMSPTAVAQYLEPEADMFDLVVFDEASQIPTAEAIGCIARAKNAVIVGDPKQLPPTTFFNADYTDEENLEYEDLESILEDCLALGIPERYLKWHYRSKHESLIAFSNTLYYGNTLCTFPSIDSLQSKVKLRYIENGVYDRGRTKKNPIEADQLVAEVIKRLASGSGKSIGIVTFSVAQQSLIENKLSDALVKNRLESEAYDCAEPVFVKNLENVQGDERDVILFSVGYGPDKNGRLALNFGPVNQANGWRRLNVAASRAREEMIIFSSITSAMIDLNKNNSKGVAGIKAFLEFAQNGKSMLAIKSSYVDTPITGIGKYIAKDLQNAGIECRYNLGVSDFKIDVAVLNRETKKFILAIICDSRPYINGNGVKDYTVLQIKTLKRLNWNVCRIWTLNYINNPKREIKRIKQIIDKITGKESSQKFESKYLKPYKEADIRYEDVLSSYLLDEANTEPIMAKLKAIVETEQPVAKIYLIKKCLQSYNLRAGAKLGQRASDLADKLDVKKDTFNDSVFYRTDDSFLKYDIFRVEENVKQKRTYAEISVQEYIAAAKSILAERISLYVPDLIKEIGEVFKLGRLNTDSEKWINDALKYGSSKGILTISMNEMVTL